MRNAQARQNTAVTVLKIVSIFLCSSYFHHAADISPLPALFYDNSKCMKFLSYGINLRILNSNGGWLLTLKLTVSVQYLTHLLLTLLSLYFQNIITALLF